MFLYLQRKCKILMSTIKENIQNTALELFLTKGYNVGINEIIQKSGTSKGAFYHHFRSKEQLFIDTIHEKFFGYLKGYEYDDSSNLTPKEKLLKLLEMVFFPFKKMRKQISQDINFLSVFAEYPKIKILKDRNRDSYNNILALIKNILGELPNSKNVDLDLISLHMVLLIDGALVDTLLLFENIDEAEKFCIKAVDQLVGLIG